ncbi:hypothetical protein XENOCAPTIV_024083, partial [Xenoophorus captivus]
CLADCGSGLLIALIDMQESGAGCQKPQKKKERTLCCWSTPAGRGKHQQLQSLVCRVYSGPEKSCS